MNLGFTAKLVNFPYHSAQSYDLLAITLSLPEALYYCAGQTFNAGSKEALMPSL
ncbi:MAG: hypothetical protein HC840_14040 [Leptolyngbyaceae cyanobacterium RM2_2_4]|nr:hypothetical protein [Leptolyngbyaceae cyanobacterium SM1_4_3]NJN90825.1 hypothetical protein [Leptolyngbyaceae cyanobacterium SL_5_14]NJO50362.1 hypothetical protein [Leptolyngbyaceae cyanobacterium RM2_2_4]